MNLRTSPIFVATLALLVVSAAQAQSSGAASGPLPPPLPNATKPIVTKIDGQPYTADFGDGRVAVLKMTTATLPKQIGISFQVYDNSCSDHRGMQCKYWTNFKRIYASLVWSKHPDPTRIGNIVTIIDKNNHSTKPIEQSDTLFGPEATYLPDLLSDTQPAGIECADFSWLPSATTNAPLKQTVLRWEMELMNINPETLANENRTFGGASGVTLTSQSPTRLDISKINALTSTFGTYFAIFMFGDVVTMTMPGANGDLCQAVLKPGGLGDVTSNVGTIDKYRTDLNTATPYIWGSSSITKLAKINNPPFANAVTGMLRNIETLTAGSVQ